MLTLVLHNGQASGYHNGLSAGPPFGYTPFTPNPAPVLGALSVTGGQDAFYEGLLDEVRLSEARSADWVRAAYRTVADNAGFTVYAVLDDAADTDRDGLPDAWEREHFGGLSAPDGERSDDWDSDGLLNGGEFTAGTDPTNGAACFAVGIEGSGGDRVVSFFAVEATGSSYAGLTRLYSLESLTNLLDGSWTGVAGYTNLPGNNRWIRYTNQAPHPSFFRGKVWLE